MGILRCMMNDFCTRVQGTNYLLFASEDFARIDVARVGPLETEWGFSAIARIPGLDILVALKVQEQGDVMRTKLAVFDLHGHMLLHPTASHDVSSSSEPIPDVAVVDEHGFVSVADIKYEGIEFLGHEEDW